MTPGVAVLMVVGPVAVFVAWRVVASGRASIWVVLTGTIALLAVLSLFTGQIELSPRVPAATAGLVGAAAGGALYLGTVAFVVVVRRWPAFERHVAAIYDARGGLGLVLALVLSAGISAVGEELYWRGLFQSGAAEWLGWGAGSVVAWAAYVAANLGSASLPITAGAVVGGAVWGALALWTHGVLASALCHAVWTGLMVAIPVPGGARGGPVSPRSGNGDR